MDFLRALNFCCLLLLCGLSASACQPSLPLPPFGPHIDEEPVIVPYPPPAARVEIVPQTHGEREVWVDGHWLWRGRRWVWQAGGFMVPPADSYYAPPITLRQEDGSLAYFEGGFRRKKQNVKNPK